MTPFQSIVVPVYNEGKNELFADILVSLRSLKGCEIIFIDGGSTDETTRLIESAGFQYEIVRHSTRAARLNAGIRKSRGNVILLHHPRSLLTLEGLAAFLRQNGESWGGFTHKFNSRHPLLSFTSWYSNNLRFRRGIVYLDHCIFVPRAWLVEVGLVPDVAIFEDTELSIKLRKFGLPHRLSNISTTSAVRFLHRGIWQQALHNQWMKILYLCGALRLHTQLNRQYEADLELNGPTSKIGDS